MQVVSYTHPTHYIDNTMAIVALGSMSRELFNQEVIHAVPFDNTCKIGWNYLTHQEGVMHTHTGKYVPNASGVIRHGYESHPTENGVVELLVQDVCGECPIVIGDNTLSLVASNVKSVSAKHVLTYDGEASLIDYNNTLQRLEAVMHISHNPIITTTLYDDGISTLTITANSNFMSTTSIRSNDNCKKHGQQLSLTIVCNPTGVEDLKLVWVEPVPYYSGHSNPILAVGVTTAGGLVKVPAHSCPEVCEPPILKGFRVKEIGGITNGLVEVVMVSEYEESAILVTMDFKENSAGFDKGVWSVAHLNEVLYPVKKRVKRCVE